MSELVLGTPAPDFDLDMDSGARLGLKSLIGKAVVLYTYPKDDTSGCTKEAKDFSDALADFTAAGAVIIGLSKDTVSSHDKFKAKHDLRVHLASDPEGKVIEAYGAWVQKSMYGKTYMGIERATFLIDAKGRLARIWRKVKVPGHVAEVLAATQALTR